MASRKTTVRLLALLLTLVLLIGLVPASALAAEVEEPEAVDFSEVEAALFETDAGIEAAEAVEIPEIEVLPEEAEVLPEPAEEAEFLPELAAEAEALPEPAAEPEAEGEETYNVCYWNYNRTTTGGITPPTFSHTAGETVYVSENTKRYSRDRTLIKNNEMYRYAFDGWTLTRGSSSDPVDTEYPLNYAVDGSFEMPAQDVDLYAHYEIIEYYHWELTVSPNGTVSHELSASEGSSSGVMIELSSESEPYKVFPTGSGDGGFTVTGTVYRSFVPQAADGYVFDGWYCNGVKLNVETLNAAGFPVLTAAMYDAGQNKIEARFMENDGRYVPVKYQRDNGDGTYYVYYQQVREKGTAMPVIADPTWDNHYFLGWDQTVPALVPDEGITLTAQWLEGPTTSNTAEALYTIRCVTGGHPDETQGMYWGTSNKDIAFDTSRNAYLCTVTLDRIGTHLGVGPACYNVLSGQEHFAEPSAPVIHLVWNGSQWVGDGDQIVNVYHETGDEPIPQEKLDSLSPIICVVETGNADNYKALKLIRNTYDIDYLSTLDSNTRAAKVTITDFYAYAGKLGFTFAPDWENNLHDEDYYVFYLTRSLKTVTRDDGGSYLYWSDWGYDKLSTEFQSTGGVYHNEFTYGKELRVRDTSQDFVKTITFTDGRNGQVFEDLVFEREEGQEQPWADSETPDDFVYEHLPELYEMQLEDGSFFIQWDPDLNDYAAENRYVTEDVTFTAVWARPTTVFYLDGAEGESFGEVSFDYLSGLEDFPAFVTDEGETEPVWEGHSFSGWLPVASEEAEGTFTDEETGYIVSWAWEDETYRAFAIFLEAQWDSEAEPSNITSTSVTFNGKLTLNAYIKLSEEIMEDEGAYVNVTFNGVTKKFMVSDLIQELDDQGRVKVRQGLYAAMMRDEMLLQLFNGEDERQPLTYKGSEDVMDSFVFTAVDYLRSRQENSTNPKMRELARAAELYGAAVQVYFDYHTEQLTAEDIAAVTAEAGKITIPPFEETEGELPGGITKRSKTVLFKEDNTLRMYFELDDSLIGNYSFTVNGKKAKPVKSDDGKYYVQQKNIAPALLSTEYTFGVSDGTDSYTMTTSVLAYAYNRQQKSDDPDMINLAKLLYRYYLAASDYFGT